VTMTAISKNGPRSGQTSPEVLWPASQTDTSSVRYTLTYCLAAGQAFHRPPQPLAHFPEHPSGRLTIVGGGCFGEPVKHGG